MIIPGDIGTLIDFFGFTACIFYCAAMVALIVMRFTKKNEPRPIKVSYETPVARWVLKISYQYCTLCQLFNSGTNYRSNIGDVDFSLSCDRTNCHVTANSILLCSRFYFNRARILRTVRLLQENYARNGYVFSMLRFYWIYSCSHSNFYWRILDGITICLQKFLLIAPTTGHEDW